MFGCGANDGTTSKTPIPIPEDRDLAGSDGFLWLTKRYLHESVTNPVKLISSKKGTKMGGNHLLAVQGTGRIRCLNCIKQSKPCSESISGGGESAQIHFQPSHVKPRLYKEG